MDGLLHEDDRGNFEPKGKREAVERFNWRNIPRNELGEHRQGIPRSTYDPWLGPLDAYRHESNWIADRLTPNA